MAPILLYLLFINIIATATTTTAESTTTTIYDHLRHNGLPIGLLPKGITDYKIDPATGEFQVNLTEPCNATFENQFHYDFNVSGVLSFGSISNLSGVSQQELFLWLPVKGVRVDVPSSGLIHFDVGVVDKQFSLSLFENPMDCAASSSPPPLKNQPEELSLRTGQADEVLKPAL